MYALNGYIPQTISLNKITELQYNYIRNCLADEIYTSLSKFITCYCNLEYKPSAPSNKISSEKEAFLESVNAKRPPTKQEIQGDNK